MSQTVKKHVEFHRVQQNSITFNAESIPITSLKAPSTGKILEKRSLSTNSLYDLLKGYVVYDQGTPIDSVQHLQYIDQCIKCITDEWNSLDAQQLKKNKTPSYISDMLSKNEKCEDIIIVLEYMYGEQIYETLLELAAKIKEMQSIIDDQNMIHRPRLISANEAMLTTTYGGKAKLPDHHSLPTITQASQSYPYDQYILCNPRKLDEKDDEGDDPNSSDEDTDTSEANIPIPAQLTIQQSRLNDRKCEGCRRYLNMQKYQKTTTHYQIQIPKYSNLKFYFHDEYCVTLRKLKESIRKFVVCEAMNNDIKKYEDVDYINDLKKHYNSLITLGGRGIKKPCPGKSTVDYEEKDEKTETQVHNWHMSSAVKCDDDTCQNIKVSTAMHAYRLIIEEKHNFGDDQFEKIPKIMKIADMAIYGESLAEFITNALLTTQLDGLWLVLAYIMQAMPTITAINVLNKKYLVKLLNVNNIDNLDRVLTTIIRSSTYTIATALYLSTKMKAAADADVSRSDDFDRLAEKYVAIALNLTNRIKSDHLLSMSLEIPTDIGQQTVLQIAFRYNIYGYMDDSRIQMLMSRMWSEFNLLNPHDDTIFTTTSISLGESWWQLLKNPAQFYYAPVGRFWIESIMYIVYVCIVTNIAYNPPFTTRNDHSHHDLTMSLTPIEYVMWIFNIGYFIAEISQMFLYKSKYLADIGNMFDVLIVTNWIIIAIIRGYCIESNDISSCSNNNGITVCIHMFVFCLQLVILWSRVTLIWRINRTVGPFIGMIPGMLADIFNWIFVVAIFFVGFAFGANFIISGDISNEECQSEGSLSSFPLVFEYVFILLMGQSNWAWLDPNECMGSGRSILLKIVMWVFSVIGTILLLNLLIAMMSSTYEIIREDRASQINFVRSKQIYSLAYRYALIPPPFNVIAWTISTIWYCMEWAVLQCTGKKYIINVSKLVPVKVNYHKQSNKSNYNSSPKAPRKTCCGGCCLFMKESKRERLNTRNLCWCTSIKDYHRRAKYCRFCKCYMRENVPGTIRYYCSLFRKYQIDEAEKKLMAVLVASDGICPECFRPYKIKPHKGAFSTNRLYRKDIVLEMLSFYVFMVTLYLPLLLLLAFPAMLMRVYKKLTNDRALKLDPRRRNRNIEIIRDFSDEKMIVDVINATNDDSSSEQIQELKDILQENKQINSELNKRLVLLENSISKPKLDTRDSKHVAFSEMIKFSESSRDTIRDTDEDKFKGNESEDFKSVKSKSISMRPLIGGDEENKYNTETESIFNMKTWSNKSDDSIMRNKSSESDTMKKYDKEIKDLENKLELKRRERAQLTNKYRKSVNLEEINNEQNDDT